MKNLLFLALITFALLAPQQGEAQSRKERKALFGSSFNYEVETVGIGADGTKVIKVWGYAKKVDQAIVQAKKNAVAACIFRGLPGSGVTNATPALATDPNTEENNFEYFENFFATGGKYLQFINLTTDGVPSGQDRVKVKKGYKVAIYAQVMHDNLRRQLIADNIIRGLNSGF